MHPPGITVPFFHPLADLTIDELRRESQETLELSRKALAVGDMMGSAEAIGRGFRVSRELRTRRERLAEPVGWGRCESCGEWIIEHAITTSGGHIVGGAPPDHCGPVEVPDER